MVVVYKWGGIAFDDYSKVKMLFLPSDADDDAPITFHDEGGSDYQVPVDKVFIVGYVAFRTQYNTSVGRVGESDGADGAITKEILYGLNSGVADVPEWWAVMGVYAAGKYVTGETATTYQLRAGCTLYGVEVDA